MLCGCIADDVDQVLLASDFTPLLIFKFVPRPFNDFYMRSPLSIIGCGHDILGDFLPQLRPLDEIVGQAR